MEKSMCMICFLFDDHKIFIYYQATKKKIVLVDKPIKIVLPFKEGNSYIDLYRWIIDNNLIIISDKKINHN